MWFSCFSISTWKFHFLYGNYLAQEVAKKTLNKSRDAKNKSNMLSICLDLQEIATSERWIQHMRSQKSKIWLQASKNPRNRKCMSTKGPKILRLIDTNAFYACRFKFVSRNVGVTYPKLDLLLNWFSIFTALLWDLISLRGYCVGLFVN